MSALRETDHTLDSRPTGKLFKSTVTSFTLCCGRLTFLQHLTDVLFANQQTHYRLNAPLSSTLYLHKPLSECLALPPITRCTFILTGNFITHCVTGPVWVRLLMSVTWQLVSRHDLIYPYRCFVDGCIHGYNINKHRWGNIVGRKLLDGLPADTWLVPLSELKPWSNRHIFYSSDGREIFCCSWIPL